MERQKRQGAEYEFYGKLPLKKAIPLGLQHVLAMFVGNLTPILIISGACGIAGEEFGSLQVDLLQNAMLIAGIVTLIQLFAIGPVGGKVPIIMGTSSGFIGVFNSVVQVMGGGILAYGAIMCASVIGGLFEGILGFLLKPLRRFFPAVVTGTVVLSIGLSLIAVGVNSFGGGNTANDFGSVENLLLGAAVLLIIVAVKHWMKGMASASSILIGIVAMVAIIWLVPAIPVNPIGALIIVIFGFFFATVSSRMVGLVGSSNNPVSGMAIATLLIATMVIKASGKTGIDGMKAAIAIGSVICIVAAIAGDTSQDLKTGYLLGATPKKQQIGELIGVVAAGLAIGGVLYLLNTAWGYGSAEVPAPQATLMKMIVEGIMGGKLPWTLVFIGVFLAIGLEILRIPVMPFAIGLYLPIYLNATIMIGGVVRMFVDGRKNVDAKTKEAQATDGTLYCAGMIAGEGLVGILLAILAVVNVSSVFDLSGSINLGNAGGVILMLLMILSLLKFSIWNKKKA